MSANTAEALIGAVPTAPPVVRFLDWSRYSRYAKAALREAVKMDALAMSGPKWNVLYDARRKAARYRREAKWASGAAARLVLVRKGVPVREVVA